VLQEERLDRVVGIDCIAAEYLSYLSGFSLSAISIWLLGLRPSILEAERSSGAVGSGGFARGVGSRSVA